jgi:hypothetical protein
LNRPNICTLYDVGRQGATDFLAFDPARLRTTGPAVPIATQEIQKEGTFFKAGFSVSENGILAFAPLTRRALPGRFHSVSAWRANFAPDVEQAQRLMGNAPIPGLRFRNRETERW